MRNLLAFVAALVLTLVGLGWYLDWFKFATAPGSDGHRTVTIDVNTNKISHDVHKAEDEVQHKLASQNQAPPPPTPTPQVVGTHAKDHHAPEPSKLAIPSEPFQMKTDIDVRDLDKWLEDR
jgi:hypothetical protein